MIRLVLEKDSQEFLVALFKRNAFIWAMESVEVVMWWPTNQKLQVVVFSYNLQGIYVWVLLNNCIINLWKMFCFYLWQQVWV